MSAAAVGALGGVARWAGGLGVAALVGQSCVVVVDAGHRAIVWDMFNGVQKDVRGEGLNFVIPVVQRVTQYEVRTRAASLPTTTGSKDLQQVSLTLRVLFRPRVSELSALHQELGPNFTDRTLPSVTNEVLKTVVAKFDAGELITQREEVSREIRDLFEERTDKFHLDIDDIAITDLAFSREYTKAIEMKQVEQQRAEQAKFVVHKAEQEKKATIIKASGEAEAATIFREAIKNDPGFIALRRIEAAREIAEELAKSRNVVYLPNSGAGSNLLLNVGGA